MKITYLHQYFKRPDENGGTRSYDLAKSFVESGQKVDIITTTSDRSGFEKGRWKVVDVEGITVYYLYLPYDNSFSFAKRSWVFISFLWHSLRMLLSLDTDVVLATSTPLTIGIPALIKKWFHKTPFVFETRDVWPEAVIAIGAIKNKMVQKVLYFLEKLIYKNAAAIVPLSIDMQKSIVSRYPEFYNKAGTVIENISEIKRFQNVNDKVDFVNIIGFVPRFIVLYAGTFGRVNGADNFITLAELTLKIDRGLIYLLMGAGSERNKIVKLAQDKEVLNKNLFVLDPISKENLPLWYNSVSMGSSFVVDIPELWANSANKFFDTLAASKPILINHEGWQADAIRRDNVGYILPSTITKEDSENFVKYTKRESLILQQGVNSLTLARNAYSLEKATEKYMTIFSNINVS